jgi:hypothetical protein
LNFLTKLLEHHTSDESSAGRESIKHKRKTWIPAFAGMTKKGNDFAKEFLGQPTSYETPDAKANFIFLSPCESS